MSSTNFFINQLSDIFTYEIFFKNSTKNLPSATSTLVESQNPISNSIVVYNLHNLLFNNRLFVFTKIQTRLHTATSFNTVSELYANAN